MDTFRSIGGSTLFLLVLFSLMGMSPTYVTALDAVPAACGLKYVDTQDFVDMGMNLADARSLSLDTSIVLIRSVSDFPQMPMPNKLPAVWAAEEAGVSFSMMRIRNETYQSQKLKVEMESFLVLTFAEPIGVCNMLLGWQEWMEKQKEDTTQSLKEAQLVFLQGNERKILRDYLEVRLVPGVDFDAFNKEVILPLQKENIEFYATTPLVDSKNGVWKVALRVKETSFALRTARILSGKHRFVSSASAIFVPLVSTVRTESTMERISSGGIRTRFVEGETIYSEQMSFENALQLTVHIDVLRNENGDAYFKLLTNISEFVKSIEDAVRPKTEGVLRIDPSTCFENRTFSPDQRYVRTQFVCRFVPAAPGRFEIVNIPLRLEFWRGGTAFTITTERNFVLNTVELRHPDQEGIVSYIGELRRPSVPTQTEPVVSAKEKTDDLLVVEQMRRTIGAWTSSSIALLRGTYAEFVLDPKSFLRAREGTIIPVLVIVFLLTAFIRSYFWGWGFIPSILSTMKKSTDFVLSLVRYASVPIMMKYDRIGGLRKVITIIHRGEDIVHLSIESLALRSGIHLDTDRDVFLAWIATHSCTDLERCFAALWIEEHKERWKVDILVVEPQIALLISPFCFSNFLTLPGYLHRATLEYAERGGFVCRS